MYKLTNNRLKDDWYEKDSGPKIQTKQSASCTVLLAILADVRTNNNVNKLKSGLIIM